MQTEIVELTKLAPTKPAFGEYLVSHRVLDRFQLFRALQMQDRMPRARLGQCAVALGYSSKGAIEHLHVRFTAALAETIEDMSIEAFVRENEPEVVVDPCASVEIPIELDLAS